MLAVIALIAVVVVVTFVVVDRRERAVESRRTPIGRPTDGAPNLSLDPTDVDCAVDAVTGDSDTKGAA